MEEVSARECVDPGLVVRYWSLERECGVSEEVAVPCYHAGIGGEV